MKKQRDLLHASTPVSLPRPVASQQEGLLASLLEMAEQAEVREGHARTNRIILFFVVLVSLQRISDYLILYASHFQPLCWHISAPLPNG